MKRLGWLVLLVLGAGWAHADITSEFGKTGRYQLFANPHANRVYVLDTQSGRMFQLINYKEIDKEILEEVPYVFSSNRLCSPAEYESSGGQCASRNLDYIKMLSDIRHEQKESAPPAPPAAQVPAAAK